MTEKRKIWHWLVLAVLSIIWGTSYILMKKGLQSFSSMQVGSIRILITFLCLSPVAIKNIRKLNRNNIISLFLIGLMGSALPAFLFPLAETRISSSLAGMLNSLSPVFTLLLGIFIYKRLVIKSQVAGIILGLIGAAGLLYNGSFAVNYYGLFVVLATIMYGFSSNEVSKVKGLNGFQIASLSFLLTSPIAIINLLLSDLSAAMKTQNWVINLSYIAILAVMGSAVALALFYVLIRDTSPVFAATVTYFSPIIATLWGLGDNEKLTVSMIFSMAVIFAGVYIINRPDFFRKFKVKQNE
jgi:drug/metabolite transporter (DMT)-like permease